MQFLLGITPSKTAENKRFISAVTEVISKKAANITKGRTYSSILSYVAVDKYDAIWIDWNLLINNYSDFH